MANNMKRLVLFLLMSAFFSIPFSSEEIKEKSSENNESENPENSESSGENSWQILEWEEEEPLFVLKYEVVIEKYNAKKKSYIEINRLMTEDNTPYVQVRPLLPVGSYRYKVITYNLIGIAEVESDWQIFNIYQAFQPSIGNVSVDVNKSGTIFLDEINDGKLTVSGKNLFEGPESETDLNFTRYYLVSANGKKTIQPEITEYSENNKKLEIQLDMKNTDVGSYYFIAEDASGLKNEKNGSSELKVKFKKRVDFDLSAGYGCPVILFDDTINEYLGSNVWPLTGVARASLIPFKHAYGYFGLGLQASYTRMFKQTSTYDLDGNYISALGNFIYQLPVYAHSKDPEKRRHILNLELHGGAGLSFFNNFVYHFPHNINSEPLNSIDFTFDAGALIQIYLSQRFFLEPDCDFIMTTAPDMVMGFVQPSVSVGWQF